MKKNINALLTLAAGSLLLASSAHASKKVTEAKKGEKAEAEASKCSGPNGCDGKTFKCEGANACKGQSSCHGAHNECKGKNSCKGKGWVAAADQQHCPKVH